MPLLTATAFRWLLVPELALGLAGILWAWLGPEPRPEYRFTREVFLAALGFTAAFAAVNFGLFYAGRRFRIAPTVYGFLEEQIFPLVQRASLPELFLAAALAGFSEELLFRGLLQPRLGLLATSAVFGILHGPSRGLLPLAAWAGGAGYVLGLLYRATGNLLLPTLVHALYDLVALLGVRCFWRAAQVEKPRAAP